MKEIMKRGICVTLIYFVFEEKDTVFTDSGADCDRYGCASGAGKSHAGGNPFGGVGDL